MINLREWIFGKKESYDEMARKVAKRIALDDEDVNGFIESHKPYYSVSTVKVSGRDSMEYLAKNYHPELEPYVDSPEKLLFVVVDSRKSGMIGIPERDTMRVYVDVNEEKVVAKEILKWDRSGSGQVNVVKV